MKVLTKKEAMDKVVLQFASDTAVYMRDKSFRKAKLFVHWIYDNNMAIIEKDKKK